MKKGSVIIIITVFLALIVGIGGTLAYQQYFKKPADQSNQATPNISPPIDETTNWKTFESKFGYSFKIPSSAKVSDSINIGNYFRDIKSAGTQIKNNEEVGNHEQAFFDNRFHLNISKIDNVDNATPASLIQKYLDKLDQTQQNPPYQNANTEIKNKITLSLKDYQNGEINGKYAMFGYEYDDGVILMTRNGSIYIFSYSGDNGHIGETTEKLINQILSTFKFIN